MRSQMDVGPAKVRRRFVAGVVTIPMQLKLIGTDLQTFLQFFYTTLAGGSLPFTWTNPRTGSACDFRFVGPPQYSPLSPRASGTERWNVQFTLETMPGTETPGADGWVEGGGYSGPGAGGGGGGES